MTSSCLDALTYFLADAAAVGNNTLPPLPPVPVTSLLPVGAGVGVGGGGIASSYVPSVVLPIPLITTTSGHGVVTGTGVEILSSSLLPPGNSQSQPILGIPQPPLPPLTLEVGVEVGGPVVTMLSHTGVIDTLKLVLSSLGRCKARLAAVRVIASLTEWPQVPMSPLFFGGLFLEFVDWRCFVFCVLPPLPLYFLPFRCWRSWSSMMSPTPLCSLPRRQRSFAIMESPPPRQGVVVEVEWEGGEEEGVVQCIR